MLEIFNLVNTLSHWKEEQVFDLSCVWFADDCDFESSTLCGFGQDAMDDFDWTRAFGSTISTNTGPPSDHTYGTNTGEMQV